MNTYYTIANVERQCYGYGDFGSEEVIKRAGPWGSGDFPPLFKSRTDVEAWLRGANLSGETSIVELHVRD